MSDENNDTTTEPAKRGRPVGAKAKRVRRNFAAELADLQSRVDVAVRLLRKCGSSDSPGILDAMTAVAIDTLEGDK